MKKFVAAFIKFSAWGVPVAILAVFAFMLVRNTWPQKVKDSVISINVVEAKGKTTGDEVQISKSALEDTLQKSAYAARREAQNEYDKNFSTLLTILTIFGIAWPLVVALAQYKFNERELDKIQAARKDAANSLAQAQTARKDNEKIVETINKFLSVFERSVATNWSAQGLVYSHLDLAMQQANMGDVSIYNMLKVMSSFCIIAGIKYDPDNAINPKVINKIGHNIVHVSPESVRNKCSVISKLMITNIKNEIEILLESDKCPKYKQQLQAILQKVCGVCEGYKRLVPDGTEEEDSEG